MGKLQEKVARDLVIMLTAGGNLDEVMELAKATGIRTIHVQQLSIPTEELSARDRLVVALRDGLH